MHGQLISFINSVLLGKRNSPGNTDAHSIRYLLQLQKKKNKLKYDPLEVNLNLEDAY